MPERITLYTAKVRFLRPRGRTDINAFDSIDLPLRAEGKSARTISIPDTAHLPEWYADGDRPA